MLARLFFLLTLLSVPPAPAGVIDALPDRFASRVLTGNATTVIKSGAGTLHMVVIGNGFSGGEIKLYDSLTGAGVMILDVIAGTASGGLLSGSGNPASANSGTVDISFTTGLTAVTTGSTGNLFTVVFQ